MKRFQGIFPVLMTIYDEEDGIDHDFMCRMVDYLIGEGVHGLVALGSNGECPYLVHEQQKEVIDTVVEAAAKRVPVIVGINERGTDASLKMARYAEKAGADGLLIALHVFYPLDEGMVYEHYRRICWEVGLPVLYYNFPSSTGLKLSPSSIARIAEIDGVVGAKETIFDVDEVRELVELTGGDFCVFTGMSFNLQAAMAVGACGAICPLPNIIPKKAIELYEAALAGNAEKATALQNEIFAFAPLLASSLTPHAMQKEALRLLGHPISVKVKSPLPQLTSEQAEQVRETLKSVGML
jgi:4-hydroxy-tetrahydrodipicolinate synthase